MLTLLQMYLIQKHKAVWPLSVVVLANNKMLKELLEMYEKGHGKEAALTMGKLL